MSRQTHPRLARTNSRHRQPIQVIPPACLREGSARPFVRHPRCLTTDCLAGDGDPDCINVVSADRIRAALGAHALVVGSLLSAREAVPFASREDCMMRVAGLGSAKVGRLLSAGITFPARAAEQATYEVEAIVGRRGAKGSLQYRVRWRGFGKDDDTWEPAAGLRQNCGGLIEKYERKKRGQPVSRAPPAQASPDLTFASSFFSNDAVRAKMRQSTWQSHTTDAPEIGARTADRISPCPISAISPCEHGVWPPIAFRLCKPDFGHFALRTRSVV